MPRMTQAEIELFIAREFPMAEKFGATIETLIDDQISVRLAVDKRHLRPGGTVAGPTLMTLADTAMFYLVLSRIGPVGHTVTTNLSINFLRRPDPSDLRAEATLLKLGRRLAVGHVVIRSIETGLPVADASVTYSVPETTE